MIDIIVAQKDVRFILELVFAGVVGGLFGIFYGWVARNRKP